MWGALPPGDDPLVTAVEDAHTLGTNVVRICISPYWDPRSNAGDRFAPLYEKVQRSDYQKVLREFGTVMITAYDVASYNAQYRTRSAMSDAAWEAMLASVRLEFRQFALELAKLPNTYIVSNWEAENDATDAQWPDYLVYLQARLDGIAAGRRDAWEQGLRGKVFSAVEFTHVKTGYTYVFDPTPPRKACGLESALALQGVDFLSYSSWESVICTADLEYARSSLRAALDQIHARCASAGRDYRMILGEIGYLRDYDPDNSSFEMLLTESLRADAELVINWVEYDQPGQTDGLGFGIDQSRFGKFTLDRQITEQGRSFAAFLKRGDMSPEPQANARFGTVLHTSCGTFCHRP